MNRTVAHRLRCGLSASHSGVGFCIPSDTVRRVVNQIIRHGRVIRPGLGVACLPDEVTANVLGAAARGVIVREVVPGSGAEQAGLRCALALLERPSPCLQQPVLQAVWALLG